MSLATRISTRYRRSDPLRADALIAAIVIVVWAVEAFALDATNGHSRVETFLVGVVAFGALALRRRNPLVAVIWFVAVSLLQTPLDTFYLDTSTLPFVVVIWLAYSIGRHLAGRPLVIGAGILLVGTGLSIALSPTGLDVGDLPFATAFVLAPLLVGRGLANRARLQQELRAKAEEAVEQSRAEAERAVELERARIATELQAVVANGISAMVVQAETVPAMLGGINGSSDRAGSALAVIEETGRDTLAEMRRLLGVLRHDGDGPLLAPQPSLERVGLLIDSARQRGLEAKLMVEGVKSNLAGGVELSAYRTVETALQGAAEAGARTAKVAIDYGEREVTVVVTDDRPVDAAAADGELAALRSRLDIYGGRLAADRGDDGFSVRARLPRELS